MDTKPKRARGAFKRAVELRKVATAPPPPVPRPSSKALPLEKIAAKNKGGRPPKLIPDAKTLELLAGLGQIWAGTAEVAAVLHVTEKTAIDFMKKHQAAWDAYERGKQIGKISLRRLQLSLAKRHPAMAIFLGKNQLGQKDHRSIDANIRTWDLSKLSEQQLDTLENILSLIDAGEVDPAMLPTLKRVK